MRVASAAAVVSIVFFARALASPTQVVRRGAPDAEEDVPSVPSLLRLAGGQLFRSGSEADKAKLVNEYSGRDVYPHMFSELDHQAKWEAAVEDLRSKDIRPNDLWRKYPLRPDEAYKLFEPQPDTPGGPWYQLSDYWMQVLRRFQVYDKGESGPGTSAYYLYRLMLDRGTLSEAQMAALTAERSGQETLDEFERGQANLYEALTDGSLLLTESQIAFVYETIACRSLSNPNMEGLDATGIKAAIAKSLYRIKER